MSIREFRASTGHLKELLASKENVVLTSNGKPAAILIDANEENFDETIENISMLRSRRAFLEMHKISKQHGNDSMTLDEINEIINECRREHKNDDSARSD
jgi:PHD/YefM family antitoxin component YafN of YafNO toxin-antitoxin module